MKANKTRILYLDIAKIIGILLVIFGHTNFINPVPEIQSVKYIIYTFHMPLFLFISGLVYATYVKDTPYLSFVKHKTLRLMVPYLVVSIILITVKLLTPANTMTVNPVTTYSYLHIFYKAEAGYFLWFLWVLWIMFLIIPFFRTKRARIYLLLFFAGLAILPVDFPTIICLDSLKRYGLYFVLGCIAIDQTKVFEYLMSKRLLTSAIFLISISAYIMFPDTIMNGIAQCVLPFAGTLLILQVSRAVSAPIQSSVPTFVVLASSSMFFIYLFHTIFMGVAYYLLYKSGIATTESTLLSIFCNVAIICTGFLCPLALYHILEKHPTPINRLLAVPYRKEPLTRTIDSSTTRFQ